MKRYFSKGRFSFPLWNAYFTLKEQLILFVLVLLGMIVRTVNALYAPLWRDEVYIFFTSRENSLWSLITQQHWDTAHPPLHSIILHFWQMVSVDPFWLRIPSLIASFFILYLVPILAVKITKKYRQFPIIFLFIFAFSHAQNSMNMVVRPYPFVVLFMIISLIIFLSILDKSLTKERDIRLFALINLVLVNLDYSAIWFFSAYLVFYILFLFIHKTNKNHLWYIFKGLLLSAVCSLTVLPLLLGNLQNSLNLERFIEPIRYEKKTQDQGKIVYLYIQRSKRKVTILDNKLNQLDRISLNSDPFPNNILSLGYNLSPLSVLFVNHYSVCLVNETNASIYTSANACIFQKVNVPLKGNMDSSPSDKVYDFQNKGSILVNSRKKTYEVYKYKNSIDLKTYQNVLLKINVSSLYLLEPPGINIFGRNQSDNIFWWKNINRFTIYPSEGQYRIVYYDGNSPHGDYLFGDRGIFEKFSGGMLFFSGVPDKFNSYILFFLILCSMCISQFSLLYLFHYKKQYQAVLMLCLFFVPLIFSILLSYFVIPIFLARNLHLVNIAYSCGLSLFLVFLISIKKSFLKLIMSGVVVLILLGYLVLFFIQFPYLHYVDPPYNLKPMIDTIEHSQLPKKHVILGNNSHYFPLLRYALLFSKTLTEIPTTTLEFLEKDNKFSSFKPNRKLSEDIFLVQFGFSQDEQGLDFEKVVKVLDCKLKQIKIPYIYFAQCE